jgi:hypothetical protein
MLVRWSQKPSDATENRFLQQILQTVVNNYEIIKNDPFGSKIYAKISKNYNLDNETGSISNPSLSPLMSETSATNSNKQSTAKSDTNNRHNGGIRRQQHHNNRKDDKRGNFNDGKGRRYSNSNQQNNMQKNGPYNRHAMPNQGMYPPMRNDMMPQANYAPGMMQPGFFMPQPQMYNQYYNYPASQQGMYYPKIY